MKRALLVVLALGTLLLSACGATGISVSDARSRSTPSNATTAVVYATITSHSKTTTLIGASVDPSIATRVTLHTEMNMGSMDHVNAATSSNMFTMTAVDNIPLGKGKKVTFSPGGYHVMLEGLQAPLTQGQSFPLTLRFADGETSVATVQVKDNV